MFGHKSFLRIGALSDSSISGLYTGSALANEAKPLMQKTNAKNKPSK